MWSGSQSVTHLFLARNDSISPLCSLSRDYVSQPFLLFSTGTKWENSETTLRSEKFLQKKVRVRQD